MISPLRLVAISALTLTLAATAHAQTGDAAVNADLQAYMRARATNWQNTVNFSFAVYSDLHMVEDPGWGLTRAQWQAGLTTWRNRGDLFGVIVGDLGYGNAGDLPNVLSGPAAVPNAPPVFYSLGNHELDGIGKRAWVDGLYPGAVRPGSWTPVFGTAAPGNADRAYWSMDVGPNTHLIFLDGDFSWFGGIVWRNAQTFGAEQLAWLRADVQANASKNIMVFVHEPVDQQPTGFEPAYTLNEKGPLLELLSSHPKQTFIFSGHYHGMGGVTKWKNVTSVHVHVGASPTYGVRVNVSGDTITLSGPGTSTITDLDLHPMNQVETVDSNKLIRVAEDGANVGTTNGPRMTVVGPEAGVVPVSGGLMLKAVNVTGYPPRFISEQLVRIEPGMKFSYDIYLSGVLGGDAVTVQPNWSTTNLSLPLIVYDQNGLQLSRRPRHGMNFAVYEDLPALGGRATGRWYHREFDLTPLAGHYVDGLYLASAAGANVSTVYVDNIRFTWPVNPGGGAAAPTNVAAAAAGATAIASSSFSAAHGPAGVIDSDRRGLNWGAGGGWNDGTQNVYPDWVEVWFNGTKTIGEIDVYTVQDAYMAPITPTAGMTFSSFGVRDFEVQYWNGSAWQAVPGGVVTGNNLVWRQFAFAPVTTSKIRVLVTFGLGGFSRLVEVEAWGTNPAAVPINQAPAVSLTGPANGASFVAPASITLSANASDADGSVTSVSFYAGAALIGSDATAPYSVVWNGVAAGNYTLTAVAVDNASASTTSAGVSVTVVPAGGGGGGGAPVNVAAAAAGATATASSLYNAAYSAAGGINGDRRGLNWGAGGGWNDSTSGVYPDWLEVAFSGSRTITEIDVFTVQDAYWAPAVPTAAMTFTQFGVRDFDVQYWNGAAWQTIPGGTVVGNNLVWRQFVFAPVTTTKIRVVVNQALAGYSRLVEVEAWESGGAPPVNQPPTVAITAPAGGASFVAPAAVTVSANASDVDGSITAVNFYAGPTLIGTDTTSPYSIVWSAAVVGNYVLTAVAMDNGGASTTSAGVNVSVTVSPPMNVAASAAGATVAASSVYGPNYPAAAVINGDRRGLNWGAGGGWNDSTLNVHPDWIEVTFSGSRTITEIDVFTLQDVYAAPAVPTAAMTFTQWGIRDFDVQYWNGSAWQTIPGGAVVGNNLVWRQFTFAPVTTTKIRVVVNQSLAGYSRVVELEAWGN